jgi:WD40 repeat protein
MNAFLLDDAAQADPSKTHVAQDLAHNRPLICCRFSPDGGRVFAGSEDETIRRWNLADGAQAELKAHESWVFALDLTPDGQTLLSGAGDGRLIWWPATADAPTPTRTVGAHTGWINHLCVSPDGGTVATAGNDGMVRLWSVSDGSKIAELPGHERPVYRLMFGPSGRYLLSADILGRVMQWELATRKEVRRFDAAKLHSYNASGQEVDYGGVRDFALSADGKLLACSGLIEASNPLGAVSNPAVVLLDWEAGSEKALMRPKADIKGVGWGVRFHPSGFLVMASGGTGGGHLWFFKPGETNEFATFNLPNTARALDLHPDGLRLAVAHHDGHLRVCSMTPAPAK